MWGFSLKKNQISYSSLYNVWNWSAYWDLPINPTKCKYINITRAPPLQLCLGTGSPDDFIQVANVIKNLDSYISTSVHCREAASKARRLLFMIRRSFTKLSVLAFVPLSNALILFNIEYAMQACSPNLVTDKDCLEQIQRITTRLAGCHMTNDYVGWVSTP